MFTDKELEANKALIKRKISDTLNDGKGSDSEYIQTLQTLFQLKDGVDKRMDRYKEIIEQLLTADKAYKCYCSKQRLADIREQQQAAKQKPRYNGH